MRRQNDDIFDEILRRTRRQNTQNNDDITIYSIEGKEGDAIVMERRREVRFIHDPQHPERGETPITVNHSRYKIGDDSRLLRYNHAGQCRFGCWVHTRPLRRCSHCGKAVCLMHSMRAGKRFYCAKGRLYKLYWIAHKLTTFSYRAVTGENVRDEAEEYVLEEDFFEQDEEQPEEKRVERIDLNEEERR